MIRQPSYVSNENLVHNDMGQNIQEWNKQNLWNTAFKKFEVMWSA